jgi:predicted Zn-dependent protease
MTEQSSKPLHFLYIFKFIGGASKHFEIELEFESLNRIMPPSELPEWTDLSFHRCTVCPLDPKDHKTCPVAANLTDIADSFSDCTANEAVHVLIMTGNRDYSKSTTLQEGLSALMGLCMASSACPVMGKLKPLVRYHLPFVTLNESVFRVASMYLLVQYFRSRMGFEPDWQMKKLAAIYEQVKAVNAGIIERLKLAASHDASLKAIATLDYSASLIPFVINETLDAIEASLDMIKKDPKNLNALIELGNAYMDTSRFPQAIGAYEQALAIDPNNVNVTVDMGICQRRSGRPDLALKAFRGAQKLQPKHGLARMNAGVVLLNDMGDMEGALKEFEKFVEIAPRDPNVPNIKQVIDNIKAELAKNKAK